MDKKYFKKFWNESSGTELTNSWGNSTYYFETDENLNVLKQLQIFQNGKILKYDNLNLEDEFGFLTNHPLEIEDFEGNEISKTEFSKVYTFETFLSNDFKSALRHFVYYYTNGTLQFVIGDKDLLKNINYREDLKDEASLVEIAFAIFR